MEIAIAALAWTGVVILALNGLQAIVLQQAKIEHLKARTESEKRLH